MECPHLKDSVLVDVSKLKAHSGPLYCNACRTHKSPWLCLTCGSVHCGRYVNGHAKIHQENHANHMVCIDSSLVAFCYVCDDNVINDTPDGRIQAVRTVMLERERVLDPSVGSLEPPSKLMKTSTASEDNASAPLPKLAGLRNLGNTCFMNSVLQSLSNIQDFCFYFRHLPAIAPPCNGKKANQYHTRQSKPEDVCLVEEFRKIMSDLTEAKATAISPDALFSALWKVAPCFRGYQQQDAHEFMRYLLDRLHHELATLVNGEQQDESTTIINRLFGGMLRNEVDCLECRQKYVKHDPFLDLSLGIPERFAQRRGRPKEAGVCHLKDCIAHFCDMEELAESEQYQCEKCRQRQRSTKKFYLRDLPPVLCLHLKRFRYAMAARSKLDLFVQFPLEGLDLKEFLSPNLDTTKLSTVYDLAAVVVHHGSGVGSGHYTAYGLSARAGGWFHFNDSTVTCSSADAVSNSKAYLLYYLQRPLASSSKS